tara:strand:+ start:123 stop:428 length:306 start_codon:yes stop_codon:yes gene_type:complete
MKKVPTSILRRINEINELIPIVNNCNEIPYTYGGSTRPYEIQLTKEIEVKNQFVYIHELKNFYAYNFDKRYNTNSEFSLEQLKYDLSLIKRAFKKVIKNNN